MSGEERVRVTASVFFGRKSMEQAGKMRKADASPNGLRLG